VSIENPGTCLTAADPVNSPGKGRILYTATEMMPHSYGTWSEALPRVIASEAKQSSHLSLTRFRPTWRRLLRRFSPRNDAEARGVIYDAPYSLCPSRVLPKFTTAGLFVTFSVITDFHSDIDGSSCYVVDSLSDHRRFGKTAYSSKRMTPKYSGW